ncbi:MULTISPECIES: Zn-dependent hydrolase [Methylorubrum]|uniref:Zn-dependent hydrolase n=1 Tax=Methylorubrum TaxID=2282523 RepID=UPI001AE81AE7|nr:MULTISPECIES: Zn-dependent hydrolase [Methylorubrum]MCJ2027961.1 Zn-dependent hydrolase [Methylobacterium sp. J-043]MDH6640132.1 N-carbamoyl-L-amino-acid hydrolase [Methylobacterium sp. SuP10 SLI 274]MCP1535613.1 N-carbamoyl-L-amino-acid hydrolase [Methylorubrum extorquens]MCP1551527.1 N-carbamoyl-L-amino-acid hydrolase [Methylorubrum zatmanii]MCP1556464.1 N-carbamoyl-L-amino-acid hydrolase [Methylorubrum extorquens]
MSNLTINAERLWDTLTETAAIGATSDGGIARLTLSDEDRQVRDWLRVQVEALGCTLTVDAVGNMFALRPGRNPDLKPIAFGSHLDTQPTGGRFDGVLGVLAGLEVLRTLDGAAYVTEAPLLLVNWTNEEGARFAPAMLGSGVYAGIYAGDWAEAREDAAGTCFGAALDAIGYRGVAAPGSVPFGAMFELHIEQGPILEAQGATIGVVQGVQGMRWYEVTLEGQSAHTGSTPMAMRRNALLGAARLVEAVDAAAHAHAPDAVGTVGHLCVTPNSHNVIPGHVFLTVDLRHPDDAVLDAMEAAMSEVLDSIASDLSLASQLRPIARTAPVAFDLDCIASVRRAADKGGHATRDIVSGAGHDAAHLAGLVPTTMVFVPSAGGLSHNPAESTTPSECAAGAQVLLDAVLDYDSRTSSSAA